jgi:hypothetical protein
LKILRLVLIKKLPVEFITANPNPVIDLQGVPCKSILTGKNLFSLQGTLFSLQGSCCHYRDFPAKPCTSLYGFAVIEKAVKGTSLQINSQ